MTSIHLKKTKLTRVPKISVVPDNNETYVYEFGPFRLDAAERLLMREGEVVALPPKVIETLLVLVEHSGHVLEKDDLISVLWPDTFVEEGSLTRNISYLRKALGEAHAAQPYIETIPRRGYRFAVPVKVLKNRSEESATEQGGENVIDEQSRAETAHFLPAENHREAHHWGVNGFELHPGAAKQTALAETMWPKATAALALNQPRPSKRWMAITALIAVVLVVAAWGLAQAFKWNRAAISWGVSASNLHLDRLTHTGQSRLPALSSDGRYVAYVQDDAKSSSLWVRQTASGSQVQIVAPADAFYRGLTFSRDNNYLYYVVYEKGQTFGALYQISLLGGVARQIIHDIDSPVTFSPDGQQLAFIRDYLARGESALMMANADGSQERTLATRPRSRPFFLTGMDWSPDGQLIACAVRHEGGEGVFADVVLVSVTDGSLRPLTLQSNAQKWIGLGQLAWLKDGSGLLAVAWPQQTSNFSDQIWYFPYPSGEPRQVTNDANTYAGLGLMANGRSLVTSHFTREVAVQVAPSAAPERCQQLASGLVGAGPTVMLGVAWASSGATNGTPNGKIVYSSDANGRSDIWVMNADGSHQQQLTDDVAADLSPAVSPDGRYVAFVSYRGGRRNIWRMNIDGRNLRPLTKGLGEDAPSFSPDGKWVVYDSFSSTHATLWKIPVDGGVPVQLTDFYSYRPVVSPDGKWLGFYFFDSPSVAARIGVIPFESEPNTTVSHAAVKAFSSLPLLRPPLLQWAADSESLLYCLTRGGTSNLWRQPLNGSAPSQVTAFTEDRIFSFALSRDGKQFVYERGKVTSDLVLISNFK